MKLDDQEIDILIEKLSEGNASAKSYFRAIQNGTLMQAMHAKMNQKKIGMIGNSPDLIGKIWEVFKRDLDEVNLFYTFTTTESLMMMMLMQGTDKEKESDATLLKLAQRIQIMRKKDRDEEI